MYSVSIALNIHILKVVTSSADMINNTDAGLEASQIRFPKASGACGWLASPDRLKTAESGPRLIAPRMFALWQSRWDSVAFHPQLIRQT